MYVCQLHTRNVGIMYCECVQKEREPRNGQREKGGKRKRMKNELIYIVHMYHFSARNERIMYFKHALVKKKSSFKGLPYLFGLPG